MSVLVTGAGGFLGSAVCRALVAAGHDVLGVHRPAAAHGAVLAADLADRGEAALLARDLAGRRVAAVVHCAAATPFNRAGRSSLAANERMTESVADLCAALEVPVLLFASGWVVYAVDRTPVAEGDRLAPATPYGASKLAAERAFAARLGGRTRLVNLRLATVFGPGQSSPGLIPNLTGAALQTGTIRLGALRTRRDYLHVDDAAQAIAALAGSPPAASLDLNLGSGASAAVLEVGELIAELAGRVLGRDVRLEVDEPVTEGTPADNVLDVSRARALGLLAAPRSLREGLADYARWRARTLLSPAAPTGRSARSG